MHGFGRKVHGNKLEVEKYSADVTFYEEKHKTLESELKTTEEDNAKL